VSWADPEDLERVSLCEALDRVLNKGVVIRGDIAISVADVELIYLGLNLLLASTEALGSGIGAKLRLTPGLGYASERR
jgi:hypothetical protein